jgi:hypothetical protein
MIMPRRPAEGGREASNHFKVGFGEDFILDVEEKAV